MKRSQPALLALLATIFIWAEIPLMLKYFTHDLDAWTVNGIRYFFTVLFWMPYVLRHYKEIPKERNIWKDATVPAVCHFLGQVGWGLAPYFNDASIMNFVSRSSFLFVILFSFWFLHEERALGKRWTFWLGAAATVSGILAMFGGGLKLQNTSATGIFLLLWTSVCWALYAVRVRKTMKGYPARLGFGIVSTMVAPGMILLMFTKGHWEQLARLDVSYWFLLASSAWLGIALGHVLYYQSLNAVGPIVAEGGLALIPFVTAISAHILLGERMDTFQWIGGILLVGATFSLLVAKRPAEKTVIPDQPAGG